MFDQVAHYKAVRARIVSSRPTLAEIPAPAPIAPRLQPEPRIYIPPAETPQQRRARLLSGAPGSSRQIAAIYAVLDEFGVTWSEIIKNRSRANHFVLMRWRVFRALDELGLSKNQIGRITGRDHTTVMHGLRKLAQNEANYENL